LNLVFPFRPTREEISLQLFLTTFAAEERVKKGGKKNALAAPLSNPKREKGPAEKKGEGKRQGRSQPGGPSFKNPRREKRRLGGRRDTAPASATIPSERRRKLGKKKKNR